MKLIINADDFGLCEDVNYSILEGFEAGNITSTTLMVNMPGTEHAVSLYEKEKKMGVGLHFCLTEGKPLLKKTTLSDLDGNFLNRSNFLKELYKGNIRGLDIKNEFVAQVEKIKKLGVEISHIDSHQHIHLIPKVFEIILPEIEKNKLPIRNSIPYINSSLIIKSPLKYCKQLILKTSMKNVNKKYLHSPKYMTSIHDFPELFGNPQIYNTIIQKYIGENESLELIVHPYKKSPQLKELYLNDYNKKLPFFEKCFFEYEVLKHKINWQNNIQLVNFNNI